jgi:hypothetical protein
MSVRLDPMQRERNPLLGDDSGGATGFDELLIGAGAALGGDDVRATPTAPAAPLQSGTKKTASAFERGWRQRRFIGYVLVVCMCSGDNGASHHYCVSKLDTTI